MRSTYRPIFFAPPDMAEYRYEFEQQLKTAGAIGDGTAPDRLGRGGRILNDPIALGNAKSKWHQSGIFIEDIEAHGVFPCRGTLCAVP